MIFVLRGLLIVSGLLALLVAFGFWFDPDTLAGRFGIAAQDTLGYSTLRADFGALFGGVGALSITAAVRNSARLLTAPLLLIGIGLVGRVVTVALSGYEPTMLPPLVVEVLTVSLFAAGRRFLAQT